MFTKQFFFIIITIIAATTFTLVSCNGEEDDLLLPQVQQISPQTSLGSSIPGTHSCEIVSSSKAYNEKQSMICASYDRYLVKYDVTRPALSSSSSSSSSPPLITLSAKTHIQTYEVNSFTIYKKRKCAVVVDYRDGFLRFFKIDNLVAPSKSDFPSTPRFFNVMDIGSGTVSSRASVVIDEDNAVAYVSDYSSVPVGNSSVDPPVGPKIYKITGMDGQDYATWSSLTIFGDGDTLGSSLLLFKTSGNKDQNHNLELFVALSMQSSSMRIARVSLYPTFAYNSTLELNVSTSSEAEFSKIIFHRRMFQIDSSSFIAVSREGYISRFVVLTSSSFSSSATSVSSFYHESTILGFSENGSPSASSSLHNVLDVFYFSDSMTLFLTSSFTKKFSLVNVSSGANNITSPMNLILEENTSSTFSSPGGIAILKINSNSQKEQEEDFTNNGTKTATIAIFSGDDDQRVLYSYKYIPLVEEENSSAAGRSVYAMMICCFFVVIISIFVVLF